MPDREKELDAAIEAAKRTVAEAERLAERCESAVREREEWEKANGIDDGKRERFFASLPPEDRRKAEEEEERFARELAHEQAAAEAGAAPARNTKATKRRNYV